MAPLVLSLVLAAFFKRARLSSFVELDQLRRQLSAAQDVALAVKTDQPMRTPRDDHTNRVGAPRAREM